MSYMVDKILPCKCGKKPQLEKINGGPVTFGQDVYCVSCMCHPMISQSHAYQAINAWNQMQGATTNGG